MKGSKRHLANGVELLFLVVMGIIFLFPIYWLVTSAFKRENSLWRTPPLWGVDRGLHSVLTAISANHLMTFFLHSVEETLGSTFIVLVLGVTVAYSLSRHGWRFGRGIANFIVSLKFMPPIASIIPVYLMFTRLRLFDTIQGMVIVYVIFNLPLATWLLVGFIGQIPRWLDDAAKVDGASDFGVLWHVILPILRPTLVGVGAVVSLFAWNDFLFAVSLTSTHAVTLPVATDGFLGDFIYQWGNFYIGGVLLILPAVLICLLLQRYVVRGLSLGTVG